MTTGDSSEIVLVSSHIIDRHLGLSLVLFALRLHIFPTHLDEEAVPSIVRHALCTEILLGITAF